MESLLSSGVLIPLAWLFASFPISGDVCTSVYRWQSSLQFGFGLLAVGLSLFTLFQTIPGDAEAFAAPGVAGTLLSFSVDRLSAILLITVSFIGLIIVRYSHAYLAGEAGQGHVLSGLCQTLAALTLFICAGNVWLLLLAWFSINRSVQRLLNFYPKRHAVVLAARKKHFFSRCSEVALLLAVVSLWKISGTSNIAEMNAVVESSLAAGTSDLGLWGSAAVCLALAAIFMCAQFPTHSWLMEIADAPTPVSALLHVGVVNAGGMLLLRFSDVLASSGVGMFLLIVIGGASALYGSLVMLTQRSVKVTQAYSTVAQMGFMLMQCGLGVFGSATLHIVAHSLHKAHAFLALGSSVDPVRVNGLSGREAQPRFESVVFGFAVATTLFLGFVKLSGDAFALHPAIIGLWLVISMGAMQLVAQASRGASRVTAALRAAGASVLLGTIYFSLQAACEQLLAGAVATPGPLSTASGFIFAFVLVTFAVITSLQWAIPWLKKRRLWQAFWVHTSNGFYINQLSNQFLSLPPRERNADITRTIG
ncbi:MAG: proton-conducting transporter membrane subunit [Pseudomonadota bacterium]